MQGRHFTMKHHTGKSPQKCYSCIKEGTVIQRKGKHTLHKSHILLSAVEFATLESFRSRSWGTFKVLCTEEEGRT